MKVAFVVFVLALIAVPALCWRFREWGNSGCSGSTLPTSHAYKNKLGQCQPLWNSTSVYFVMTSDCDTHKTTSILTFSDAGCTTLTGAGAMALGPNRGAQVADPDFWYVSNGCQGNRAAGESWNIDCKEVL